MEIIPVYGADALRFSMIMITAQGADVFLSKETFDLGRNFANKLWNASRFLLGTMETKVSFAGLPPAALCKAEDTWILSRLQNVIVAVTSAIGGYRFNEAAHTLYDFSWHEFCDWYVEAKKSDLYQTDDLRRRDSALAIICHVHASLLKLLHPFVPFITEEIWSSLREKVNFPAVIDSETIMTASFPVADSALIDEAIERKFALVMELVTALRTIRSENNVPPDRTGRAVIIPESAADAAWLATQAPLINQFAKLSDSVIDTAAAKPAFAGSAVVAGMHVYLLLEGLIDPRIETERLTKEIARVNSLIENAEKRLESEAFVSRAPEAVVAKEKEKLAGLLLNKEKLEKGLAALRQ
jgi:valyl-tRNA synthetase